MATINESANKSATARHLLHTRSWPIGAILVLLLQLGLTACAPATNGTPSEVLADDSEAESFFDESLSEQATRQIWPEKPYDNASRARILSAYQHLDPQQIIRDDLLERAVLFHFTYRDRLRTDTLSIIDFSKPSWEPRFYLVNLKTGAVHAMHVSHGSGSDANRDGYAESFSNRAGSNASSLGFYVGAETYQGKNGLSLRLDGRSDSNSNARARAVVIHGADYVQDRSVTQGRSWGCPAVSWRNLQTSIQGIKQGGLLFIGR